MPKRTNDFQELVDLIHRALVPKGAKIGSSVMLPSSTGDMREIDVLIESDIGPYCIKIAVEAKDHNRKLDVTEIDNLIGKYTDGKLNINKIIIVSRSGFTDLAYKKAVNSHLDIELKTLKEAKEISWDDKIPQDIILNIPPHLLDIKLSGFNS